MRVLAFGTYDRDVHPRIGVILDGLHRRGTQVVELNVPLGLTTQERLDMLRRPVLVIRLVVRIARCWSKLSARSRQARRSGRLDAVVVGYLGQFDVLLAKLLFPRTPIVLDLLIFGRDTAHDRGVTGRLLGWVLATIDWLAIHASSLVLVDTAEHLAMLPASRRNRALVVPVGAPDAWFRDDMHRQSAQQPMSVIFYGLFTPLHGTGTVGRAIAALAHAPITFTLIGRGQDYEACRRLAAPNPNVRWLDWVPADQLPGIVAAHDVCLGIFGATEKAARVVPNKVYQGAAAGCAILTSDTPPQRRTLGDGAAFVPVDDPLALVAALESLASDRARLHTLQSYSRQVAHDGFHPVSIVGELWGLLEAAETGPISRVTD